MKKKILDNLPTVWIVGIILLSIVLVSNHANAGEKTKAEWNALYTEAGCMDLNFFQIEICKSKVFQKTNWTESKYQLKGFFEKFDLN